MSTPHRGALRSRVIELARRERLPGFRSKRAISHFIGELAGALRTQRVFEGARFKGSPDVTAQDFHPYVAVRGVAIGDIEEALWLTFLTTACGALGKPGRWTTVRALYGGLGDGVWSWPRVSADPNAFRGWMVEHQTAVKALKFGNHRKYETHDPHKQKSTADVVESYVRWVEKEGGGSQAAIFAKALDGRSAEDAFDVLYHTIRGVRRFGRTAKFDWLCLIGNLRLFAIRPGRCHLKGASGPLAGAQKLFGRLSLGKLEQRSAMLATTLGVPVEAVEDTLCNWQKSRGRPKGWLTISGCGS